MSALAVENSSGILAIGKFSSHVGLYGSGGQSECIGVFQVKETRADKSIGSWGVT
jgi:hypothetical protein